MQTAPTPHPGISHKTPVIGEPLPLLSKAALSVLKKNLMLPGYWAEGSKPDFSLCLILSYTYSMHSLFWFFSMYFVSALSGRHILIYSEQYTYARAQIFFLLLHPHIESVTEERKSSVKVCKKQENVTWSSDLIQWPDPQLFHFLTQESWNECFFISERNVVRGDKNVAFFSTPVRPLGASKIEGWFTPPKPQTAGRAFIFIRCDSMTALCFRAHSARWQFWKTEDLRSC